jgi:hypothetical protein
MKKNRPVDKFYKTIENAQKKIDAIRKKCKHKKTHIGMYSWRIGAFDQRVLCDDCDAPVGNPYVVGSPQIIKINDSCSSIINILDNNNNQLGGSGL